MSVRKFIFMLFYFKWLLIVPALIAPVISFIMLLFVEPSFSSSCKLWTKEHAESSQLLRVQRAGTQETTFVEVQREIIMSDGVFNEVIDKCDLLTPPPSQTLFAKITGMKQKVDPISEGFDPKIEALRALRHSVWTAIVNPEILTVEVKMNSPELAQKVLLALLDSYRSNYLRILSAETKEYRQFLSSQLEHMRERLHDKEQELIDYEQKTPLLQTTPGQYTITSGSLDFANGVGDFSPVPAILKELATLEMMKVRALSRYDKDASKIAEIERMIAENQTLLEQHSRNLSEMAKKAVLHKSLQWELQELRRHISEMETEYYQINISEGAKVKQVSNITVLEQPEIDIRPVYPKKKATIMASVFLGLIFGVGLVYLRIFTDGTYHLPEDIVADTGLSVIQVFPKE